ncbi:MAG: isocitrate dehydrogenase (NAD(+)) [candidate division KSB1 bacterium]|nr:isocitrate dehydrogenase (NAD(+)) [candidate division KSB1 bacterium]MDZ7367201.1 isocitrate dehydrogenase (NAD(+)) [candidate division KSB1 bacterium]MDZ7405316.1 isocitrate dehydrogenase (NAD(+)) [candidate division KSB1 bacterium]
MSESKTIQRVTLIPGDGIGPEVSRAAVKVIDAAGANLEWDEVEAGIAVAEKYGKPLPDHVLDKIKKNRVALKGPLTTIVGKGFASVNVELRKTLDLYANLRPVQNLPGIQSRFGDIDLVVVRENTEDLYSGLEHKVAPGVTQSLKIITKKASARIVKFAFDYAMKHHRKKVTAVHKANIMKISDGLFLETAQKVARDYPQIQYQEVIVDNLCMQLVMKPQQYDVLVLTNLYGDIVSDLCAGLVGGLGLVPGANIGDKYAVFEAVHGSAPDIAGKGIANPLAIILSGILMLEHIGQMKTADKIRQAVHRVTEKGKVLTPDLGGKASTMEMAEAIIAAMNP